MYGLYDYFMGQFYMRGGYMFPVKKSVEKIVRKVYNKNIFRRRKSL